MVGRVLGASEFCAGLFGSVTYRKKNQNTIKANVKTAITISRRTRRRLAREDIPLTRCVWREGNFEPDSGNE
jgi:hypothetical protein